MKITKTLAILLFAAVALTACNKNADAPEAPESTTGLYINEVTSKGDDFIEFYNATTQEINMRGFEVNDGDGDSHRYIIELDMIVPAGGFASLVKGDANSFTFGISAGDVITLLDSEGMYVDRSPEIPTDADVSGKSWGRTTDGGDSWGVLNPSSRGVSNNGKADTTEPEEDKGEDNSTSLPASELIGKVVINEVYTYGDQSTVDQLDWIELYNTSQEEIDLSGIKVWEAGGREKFWPIPAGAKIPAGGRYIIESDKDLLYNDTENYPSWGLSKGPDEYVVIADSDFNHIDSIALPSLMEFESYGRVSDGAQEWQIFEQHTFNAPNEGQARQEHTNTVGVWVNEVYHDNTTDFTAAGWDASVDFIEFYNSTDATIDMSGWVVVEDSGDSYTFPQGTEITAGGFLTVDVYKGNESGPAFGLGASGDWVSLYKAGGLELVDQIEVVAFSKDSGLRDNGYTYGRTTDGGDELAILAVASKNSSNNGTQTVE